MASTDSCCVRADELYHCFHSESLTQSCCWHKEEADLKTTRQWTWPQYYVCKKQMKIYCWLSAMSTQWYPVNCTLNFFLQALIIPSDTSWLIIVNEEFLFLFFATEWCDYLIYKQGIILWPYIKIHVIPLYKMLLLFPSIRTSTVYNLQKRL